MYTLLSQEPEVNKCLEVVGLTRTHGVTATINWNLSASDKRTIVGRQESNHTGDLIYLTRSSQGMCELGPLQKLKCFFIKNRISKQVNKYILMKEKSPALMSAPPPIGEKYHFKDW